MLCAKRKINSVHPPTAAMNDGITSISAPPAPSNITQKKGAVATAAPPKPSSKKRTRGCYVLLVFMPFSVQKRSGSIFFARNEIGIYGHQVFFSWIDPFS
ncbi:hypothetical protein CUS_5982 [Ruminococcus albus 8]|uniref:Uncharacterized protein n=1 Tax=Ruminococcus albus 8 TaxID=246199 RepID=E9SEF2_RUMAL|nr:hypothetical protein CUS_5982 [Ruminococcus albus 8]